VKNPQPAPWQPQEGGSESGGGEGGGEGGGGEGGGGGGGGGGDAAAAPNCTSVRYNWYRDWKSELVWVVMYTCHTRAVIGDVNVALWSPPMLLSHTKADPGTVTICEAAFWYRNSTAPNE
jgi:hypothetical protein